MANKKINSNVLGVMYTEEVYVQIAMLLKLFADPTRIKLLHILSENEMFVDEISENLNVSKSAVSHHLKQLRAAKLVNATRNGQNIYYTIADNHAKLIVELALEHLKDFNILD